MSALLQREPSVLRNELRIPQTLQLRQIPHVLQVRSSLKVSSYDNYFGAITRSLFGDLRSNWLYGAPIQLIFNESRPSWTSEDWAFVPIDLTGNIDNLVVQSELTNTATNITYNTPAIRARLECTNIDTSSINWLTPVDSRDQSLWNSNTDQPFTTGYQLGCNDSQPNVGGKPLVCKVSYIYRQTNVKADWLMST